MIVDPNGFVFLWRKSIDSIVFQNEGVWKIWTWCLIRANHKKMAVPIKTGRSVMAVEVGRGQFVFGRKEAAKQLRMKESTVWKRMKLLEKYGNLNINSGSHYSIVTIINFSTYNDMENKSNSKRNKQVTSKEQASNTNNNETMLIRNPKKKILKEKGSFIPDDFTITEEMKSWFKTQNFKYCKLESQTDEFIDYWKGVAGKKSDWVATWRNGMRQKEKWLKKELGEDESWRISQ